MCQNNVIWDPAIIMILEIDLCKCHIVCVCLRYMFVIYFCFVCSRWVPIQRQWWNCKCKPPQQISALNMQLSFMITIINKTFFLQNSHHSYPINQLWGWSVCCISESDLWSVLGLVKCMQYHNYFGLFTFNGIELLIFGCDIVIALLHLFFNLFIHLFI